ncbi:MAG: PEP-CTERM-box response regulator transcription factor [Alphaproteobacteria bacterium]|nr:PEP-CTERM-box response regulator transcription factor [Alphaproteobacteria bacterium]
MQKVKILFVDDDQGLNRQLRWAFSEFETRGAHDRPNAVKLAATFQPQVVVLDLGLPPDAQGASEGLKTLVELKKLLPSSKIIMLSGNEERENAVMAVKLGAYDFCQKPMDQQVLRLIIERAINLLDLEQEVGKLATNMPARRLENIITGAPNMQEACDLVERIAPTDASVLLLGESGTGKELFARALHDLSPRKASAFVPINCGAIPETLLESELFGHEKGAFTGAERAVVGKIELADGGTLFLDEIADMPYTLQVKLLRFLQDRIVERVGSRKPVTVDVRVVCATNQDVESRITTNKFREDLYFRVNEVTIRIPALRDRPGDPELLAQYFLEHFGAVYGKSITGFSPDALQTIRAHPWPGNVRQLQNCIKRAVILTKGNTIGTADLGLARERGGDSSQRPAADVAAPLPAVTAADGANPIVNLREARNLAEKRAIEAALAGTGGNISKAAKLLGVSRPTLYTLISEYGIAAKDDEAEG